MIITCLGHSKFLLALSDGTRIVTDPYDSETGYPMAETQADVVLVSHHHHDHDAVDTIGGHPRVIDTAGTFSLSPTVKVSAMEAFHDEVQGAKRGKNLLFLLEADGLKVAHLGDLGHRLNDAQVAFLHGVDVLMLPVGGYYTIDAEGARDVAGQVHPHVILPMHYRTRFNASWPIAPVDAFTALYPKAEHLSLLRITKDDLPCQPHVAVLDVAE